jgi:hypothetical protein
MFVRFLITLILPVFIVFFMIFILPWYSVMVKFGEHRKRTMQIHRMAPHDNRFQGRDFNNAVKDVGCLRILGLSLLSIVISPLTFVILAIPFIIFILVWILMVLFSIYFLIVIGFKLCCGSSQLPQQQVLVNQRDVQRMAVQNPEVRADIEDQRGQGMGIQMQQTGYNQGNQWNR